jgi:hypothetical protein
VLDDLEVIEDEQEFEEQEERERRPRKRKKRMQRRARSSDFLESMPLSYAAQTNLGVGIAILVNVLGFVLYRQTETIGLPLYLVFYLTAVAFWAWGFCAYARMKGYTAWLGLLGFGAIFGLLVLVLLPYKDSEKR